MIQPLFAQAASSGVAWSYSSRKIGNKMTQDIFDNKILCKKCETPMQKAKLVKNGFVLRAMICPECHDKIVHPVDENEFNKFVNLKNKEFRVKMRLVGNSYAVSIPKEIVSFMNQQRRLMDDMVKLCFEEAGRVSLNFHDVPRIKKFKKEEIEE